MNDQSSDGEIETETESSSTEEHEVERMDAILGEDEKKEKLVYIFVVLRRNYELRVNAFNPHQRQFDEEDEDDTGGGARFVDVTNKFKKEMPPDLKKIKYFGLASLGPTIYFMGGRKEKKKKKKNYHSLCSLYDWEATSNKVFAFDTESEQWLDTVACMKLPRRSSSIVTYDHKIYAFGGAKRYFPQGVTPPPALWAEFYDPKTDTWDYLGGGDPPEELRNSVETPISAVFKEQEICLLCIWRVAVYVYSFKCKRWLQRVSDPAFNLDGCSWNSSVVSLNNTLFWECHGRILTIDYPPRQPPVVKRTLPEARRFFGEPGPDAYFHRESCLVDAGNGKLCLVYDFWDDNKHKENFVCFHTFELGGRSRGGQFLVHHKHHQIYPCPDRSYGYFLIAIAATTRCTAAQAQLYPRGHGQNVAARQTSDARIGVPTCCSEPTQVGFGRSKKKLQGTKLNWKTLG